MFMKNDSVGCLWREWGNAECLSLRGYKVDVANGKQETKQTQTQKHRYTVTQT